MPKCQQYLHFFIADVIVPLLLAYSTTSNKRCIQICRAYEMGDAYQRAALNSINILKAAALIREWCSFDTRGLLEEIRHTFFRIFNCMNLAVN